MDLFTQIKKIEKESTLLTYKVVQDCFSYFNLTQKEYYTEEEVHHIIKDLKEMHEVLVNLGIFVNSKPS